MCRTADMWNLRCDWDDKLDSLATWALRAAEGVPHQGTLSTQLTWRCCWQVGGRVRSGRCRDILLGVELIAPASWQSLEGCSAGGQAADFGAGSIIFAGPKCARQVTLPRTRRAEPQDVPPFAELEPLLRGALSHICRVRQGAGVTRRKHAPNCA